MCSFNASNCYAEDSHVQNKKKHHSQNKHRSYRVSQKPQKQAGRPWGVQDAALCTSSSFSEASKIVFGFRDRRDTQPETGMTLTSILFLFLNITEAHTPRFNSQDIRLTH